MSKDVRLQIILEDYRDRLCNHRGIYDYPLVSMILSDDKRNWGYAYHPRSSFDNQSIHAEVRTLKNYCAVEKIKKKQQQNQYIKKIELLVFRVNAKMQFVMARPCRDCACAIYNSQIVKRIYFTNECGNVISCTPLELLQVSTPIIMQRLVDYYNGCNKAYKKKNTQHSQRYKKVSSEKYKKTNASLIGARKMLEHK